MSKRDDLPGCSYCGGPPKWMLCTNWRAYNRDGQPTLFVTEYLCSYCGAKDKKMAELETENEDFWLWEIAP